MFARPTTFSTVLTLSVKHIDYKWAVYRGLTFFPNGILHLVK